MTKQELLDTICKNVTGFVDFNAIKAAVDAYSSASNDAKPDVSGALPLNGVKATELAQIGSKYVYEDALGYGRISEGGIFEIIKKYEEFRRQ